MPRPRSAPSRAAVQMQGFQPTRAWPGHNGWPNGQRCGLCSNRGTGITMIMSLSLVLKLVRRKKLTVNAIRAAATRLIAGLGFTIARGIMVSIDGPADPERLSRLGGMEG
jgi:hypothetical protein